MTDCIVYTQTRLREILYRVKKCCDPFCPIHNTKCLYCTMMVILRSSTVASLPYFVFCKCVFVRVHAKQHFLRLYNRYITCIHPYVAWSLTNALEIGSQTNIFVCWLSFSLCFSVLSLSSTCSKLANVALFCIVIRKATAMFLTLRPRRWFSLPAFVHLAKALHDITY